MSVVQLLQRGTVRSKVHRVAPGMPFAIGHGGTLRCSSERQLQGDSYQVQVEISSGGRRWAFYLDKDLHAAPLVLDGVDLCFTAIEYGNTGRLEAVHFQAQRQDRSVSINA